MATITVNVDSEDKERFNEICSKLGMNISTAVNIFIKKVNSTRAIPVKVEVEEEYSEETLAACREAMAISEGKIPAKRYDSFQEAMEDLGLYAAEPEPEYGA